MVRLFGQAHAFFNPMKFMQAEHRRPATEHHAARVILRPMQKFAQIIKAVNLLILQIIAVHARDDRSVKAILRPQRSKFRVGKVQPIVFPLVITLKLHIQNMKTDSVIIFAERSAPIPGRLAFVRHDVEDEYILDRAIMRGKVTLMDHGDTVMLREVGRCVEFFIAMRLHVIGKIRCCNERHLECSFFFLICGYQYMETTAKERCTRKLTGYGALALFTRCKLIPSNAAIRLVLSNMRSLYKERGVPVKL